MAENHFPPEDRRNWQPIPIVDRVAYAHQLIILHPRFREAVNLLERCRQGRRPGAEPVCGALLGTSGVGKTTVIDHYHRLHPPQETDTATRRPVLKVTLQPDARPKGIAADILLALGDPAWSSGTVQTLTNRAVQLARCGVGLIVLDEFHHLFDFDRARVMTKASQWLKVLIVNTGIPVVVAGMPEAAQVLRAEHTERRFKDRLVLRCFTWRTPEGQREFCGMLKKLDDTVPLAEASGLAGPELAGRCYLACRGIPDYLMTLVRGAVCAALQRGAERLELADLARVYEAKLAPPSVCSPSSPTPLSEKPLPPHWTASSPPTRTGWRASGSPPAPPGARNANLLQPIIWEAPDGLVALPARSCPIAAGRVVGQPAVPHGDRHGLRQRQPAYPLAGPDLQAPPECKPTEPRTAPGAVGRLVATLCRRGAATDHPPLCRCPGSPTRRQPPGPPL
jgi:hypothetical protein